MAQTARVGDTVKIHYKGSLEDGSVFDSSEGTEPIEFTLGEHEVIGGLEEAIVGMSEGDKKVATIPPESAYGDREDDLVFKVSR